MRVFHPAKEIMMATSVFLVHTEPVPGRDDEYNDWYTNRHIPDVLSVPGFVAAQRFVISSAQRNPAAAETALKYLAVYEIEGDSQEAVDNLAAAAKEMFISEAMGDDRLALVFDAITVRATSSAESTA
jgi:hypothetical protein